MAAPVTCDEFLDHLRASCLINEQMLERYIEELRQLQELPTEPQFLGARLVQDGFLTTFQLEQLLHGRYRNFIIGKYKLLQPLGAGGMSQVFLCQHIDLGKRVAMKVLSPRKGTDPVVLARFFREARIIAGLQHPNVVRAHDIDICDNQIHYIIMDYIEGLSLAALVRRRGRLDPDHAANYIAQAACGLQYIHDAGLIHRDIKPHNLLVDRTGVIKILDLGLARLLQDDEQLTAKFNGGTILGTADFIAPEAAVLGGNIDQRVDIYGLGVTFYFLLTGRVPFEATNVAEKLISHRMRDPAPVRKLAPHVSRELAAIVQRMMAKRREDRYATAAEVLQVLARWIDYPVPPPSANELPRLGPAALGNGPPAGSRLPGSMHIAAARATLTNLGDTHVTPPKNPRQEHWWPYLVVAIATALFAAILTVLVL